MPRPADPEPPRDVAAAVAGPAVYAALPAPPVVAAPAAEVSDATPTRGRRRPAVVLTVLLIGLVIGVVIWRVGGRSDSTGEATPTSVASTQPQAAAPPPPVPLPAGAAYTQVRVLRSGDLAVQHWISSATALSTLTVAVPPDPHLPPGSVTAGALEVIADNAHVDGATLIQPDAPATYSFEGTSAVYVSYVLAGGLERSDPAATRAMVRVAALDLTYSPDRGPTTIAFVGPEVLALACTADVDDVPLTPCGAQVGETWSVGLPGPQRGYRVMAQVELSDASSS